MGGGGMPAGPGLAGLPPGPGGAGPSMLGGANPRSAIAQRSCASG
jgi:hypothetical protein